MPKFEANQIVAQAGRLNKYVADRKMSYNTYDDEGSRVFVKKMSGNTIVKQTRWNERNVR